MPFAQIPYLNAARGGKIEEVLLPLLRATVTPLPESLDAIVAAADLQGREDSGGGVPGRLLGERLAEELVQLSERGVVPDPGRTGVLLAGDLYSVPLLDRRGKSGDVGAVWRAFVDRFRWVAGVAGNHDDFAGRTAGPVSSDGRAQLLDGNTVVMDGLKIGGVGGIVGSPTRQNRKEGAAFVRFTEAVLDRRPDVLVCHEGPDFPLQGFKGSSELRRLFELWAEVYGRSNARLPLVVCGHCWWPEVFVQLDGGIQVLKVDARVVVLECAARPSAVSTAIERE